MWVHDVLGLSNLLGVFALFSAHTFVDQLCALAVMTASMLAHFSETRHALTPDAIWLSSKVWTPTVLINIDRAVAVAVALYGLWKEWPLDFSADAPDGGRHAHLLRVLIVSTIATIAGELTYNHALYVGLHLIWHAGVFYALYVVLSVPPPLAVALEPGFAK